MYKKIHFRPEILLDPLAGLKGRDGKGPPTFQCSVALVVVVKTAQSAGADAPDTNLPAFYLLITVLVFVPQITPV